MADLVKAADVLAGAAEAQGDGDNPTHFGSYVLALLAHGAGDPVVIMPDGTLRRFKYPVGGDGPTGYVSGYYVDPVQP